MLRGDAICNNSNPLSGMLIKADIHISMNDVSTTDITQSVSIDIPKIATLRYPLIFHIKKKASFRKQRFFKRCIEEFSKQVPQREILWQCNRRSVGCVFDVPVVY